MVVPLQTIVEHIADNSVLRGRLESVEADGTLVVRTGTQIAPIQCDCLNPADITEPYSIGDEVLIMTPVTGANRGCVLGVVGRYRTDHKKIKQNQETSIQQEHIEIVGEKSVVLRCGDASLTLTDDGSVVIKATRMLQRSKGIIKIKGAAVQVN